MRLAALASLLGAVAVAFADSSIVVLALPDLLSQFDASIEVVAWVVTAYNLVLAIGALAYLRFGSHLDARRVTLVGSLVFLAASLGCALAPEVWSLIAFRSVQGLGATLLLLGALPLVRALVRTPDRGTALWTGVGVFGAALGPALGGVLTDVFGWRAIFVAQAPVAALAVLAAVMPLRATAGDVAVHLHQIADARPVGRRSLRARWTAGASLALASGALVGLLFLAVVELIDVWRLSPLTAGGVVTAIPLATLAAVPVVGRLGGQAAAAGAVLLGGGLAGMAFLPARSLAWAIAALALAGLGYGLLVPSIAERALVHGAGAGSIVALRHLGLVGGLLVLTPLLAADLTRAADQAQLRGISVVLDAPVAAESKLRLAVDLAPAFATPAQKGLPDFKQALAREHDPSAVGLGSRLDATVQATIGRAFRGSFAAAAALALLAGVPRVLAAWRRVGPVLAAALAALVLVGAELGDGARAYGARPRLLPRCAHRAEPSTQSSSQRAVLASLDLVACHVFHETREQLVVDAAEKGVAAADFVTRIERLAKLASRIP